MISTMRKSRKQIDDLKMNLEVINPIESKILLGGEWYDDPPAGYDWQQSAYATNNYHDYSDQYNSFNETFGFDYSNDWNNSGGGDGSDLPYDYYPISAPVGGDEANEANELAYFAQTLWNLGVGIVNGAAWIANEATEHFEDGPRLLEDTQP